MWCCHMTLHNWTQHISQQHMQVAATFITYRFHQTSHPAIIMWAVSKITCYVLSGTLNPTHSDYT